MSNQLRRPHCHHKIQSSRRQQTERDSQSQPRYRVGTQNTRRQYRYLFILPGLVPVLHCLNTRRRRAREGCNTLTAILHHSGPVHDLTTSELHPQHPGHLLKAQNHFRGVGCREIGLIGLLIWHTEKSNEETCFSTHALLLVAINLVPALMCHTAVAWLWPSLMRERKHILEARKKF